MPKRKPTKPAPAPSNDLERAVREAAELMGLNPDRISPADRLRCELIAALRRVIDDQLAQVASTNSSDLSKLVTAVEMLTRFLTEAKPNAERPDGFEDDPHENLMRIIENWVEGEKAEHAELAAERVARGLSEPMADLASAQARIDELEARLAEFESGNSPKALPAPEAKAPESERVIDPPTSDIVPPGEQGRLYVGPPPPAPDDHRVRRPGPVIDAKAKPVAPTAAEREAKRLAINSDRSAYTQQGLRPAGGESWRGHTWRFE